MEKQPSIENKEGVPITPESVLLEIRSRFSNSRELANQIRERDESNYANVSGEIKTSKDAAERVLERLARIRHRAVLLDTGHPFYNSKYPLETDLDEDVGIKEVVEAFKSGQRLGMLISAVYYGEATFIGNDGSLLSEPVNM